MATPPTPIALTRTSGASSTARLRVSWLSAALPAPYAANELITRSAERDEMLTMAPPPAVSTIAWAASWLIRNGAVTLNRIAISKNASEVCIAGRGPVPPALLTRMSSRPNAASASSTRR